MTPAKIIPFSPPRIDELTIREVVDVLQSGWITTGPKVKELEERFADYTQVSHVVCLNSASAGLELVLRWFGVQEGDEVIVPAYTYCATANVVLHCGAKPVMVDVNPDDFNINVENIRKAITHKTKAIIPVDFAGFPCDYDAINNLIEEEEIRSLFKPRTDEQKLLCRILVMADAAHSAGAIYKGKKAGSLTDITVFSFHAVKNLTTAEGGAICLNLPSQFNNESVYRSLKIKSLHGQNKDAFAKMQIGNWRYDVTEAGYKCNMTDILAAIGLVELKRYDNDMLIKRKAIFDAYTKTFSQYGCFQLPVYETFDRHSSYHVYPLRIKDITEEKRDVVMQKIFDANVCVNVHFIPLPMLSVYKNLKYDIKDYPVAYDNFSREISLPVYYDLTDEQIQRVIHAVLAALSLI